MKVTELTIGSLIKTNKGEIIKVESISTKRQHRKVGYHKDGDCYHIKYVRLAQCEGIPLTEEILKVNGFVNNREFWKSDLLYNYWDNERLCVEIMNDVNNVDVCVKYIHELQHALRLCGLNDLADNLKLAMENKL